MSDHDPVDVLRAALADLAPTPHEREHIAATIAGHLEQRSALVAPAPPARGNSMRRSRRPRIAIGAIVAIAALVAVLVALGPSGWVLPGTAPDSGSVAGFVGPDTAAARELVRIGDAAGSQPWRSLRDGEFYRVYSTTVPGDSERSGGTSAYEVWLDPDGHGKQLTVMGAANPARYPTITPGGGMGVNASPPKGGPVSLEASLRAADSVNVMSWPVTGAGFQRSWVRQPGGYELTYDSTTSDAADPTETISPEQTITSTWGVSTEQLYALPTSGDAAEMDAAITDLVQRMIRDARTMEAQLPTGALGITRAQLDREYGINAASHMLASAPLPPAARRSLFRWLATQPGAELDRSATDAIGRDGVEISFARRYRAQVPAQTITVQDLIDAAIDEGSDISEDAVVTRMGRLGRREQRAARTLRFMVPAHTEQRTWEVSLVLDPKTGDLLQQRSETRQQSSTVIPRLVRGSDPDHLTVIETLGANSLESSTGSNLYFARDIARLDQPLSPVCASFPTVCRG